MALNENITVRLIADISNYSAQMKAASRATDAFGESANKPLSAGQLLASGLTKLGAAVGVASAAIGVSAVKSFMDFDAAMSEVQANTGATGDELASLRELALDMGSTTTYSATECAQAVNELGKAGMSTADIISGGLSGALNLAASDSMAVADAAEYVSSALAMFHLEGSRAADVADALAAGAGEALGGVADFGEALNNCGAQAYSFGVSMEETVGVLALFAQNGLTGATAGTQLNSMLNRLANPTTAAAKTMKELGISVYDAQGNFVGLAGLAGQLAEKEAHLSDEARNAANSTMFGSYAIKAANYLYEAGAQGVQDWTDKVSQSGYAADLAAAKTDNLKGDLTKLASAVDGVLISIGEGANGPFRSFVQSITDAVKAFSNLDPAVQQWTVLAGLAAGATVLLHSKFGGLAESSSNIARSFGLMMDPIQRFQGLASGLHGAFTLIRQSTMSASDQISVYGSSLTRGQAITGAFKSAGQGLVSFLGGPWGIAFTVASSFIMSFIRKQAEAKQTVNDFKTALSATGDASEAMVEKINNIEFNKGIGVNSLLRDYEDFNAILKDAGISLAEFAAAAMGNEDAIKSVSSALDEFAEKGEKQNVAARVASDNLEQLQGQYAKAKEEADETAAAVDELNGSTDENAAAADNAASAAQNLADAWELGEKAVSEQADAIAECVSQMQKYYGYSISAGEAQIKMHDAFDAAAESVEKYGQNTDIATEAGRKNMSALYDIASATIAAAEAQARNGATVEELNGTLDLGREKLKFFAEQMKLGNVDQFVKDCGLGEDAAQRLTDAINETKNSSPAEVEAKVEGVQEGTQQLDNLGLKVTSLPDGKVMVYGDTKDVIDKFAEIEGVNIDKEGRITATKEQYDQVMGIVKADKVEPKKVDINGNPNDYNNKSNTVKADKIPQKTAVINGNNTDALSKIGIVNNREVRNKSFSIIATDNASSVVASVDALRIANKSFTIEAVYTSRGELAVPEQTKVEPPRATGGIIHGPGTGTSDSVPARLSNGEFVVNARATAANLPLLEKINRTGHYAQGGYVQAAIMPQILIQQPQPQIQYVQNVTNRMYSTGDQQVQARLLAAKMQVATRKLLK